MAFFPWHYESPELHGRSSSKGVRAADMDEACRGDAVIDAES